MEWSPIQDDMYEHNEINKKCTNLKKVFKKIHIFHTTINIYILHTGKFEYENIVSHHFKHVKY